MTLLTRWRQQSALTPVIVLTARQGLSVCLTGLNSGADDFLVKPFAPQELVARIHVVVRRAARQACNVWRFGDLEVEPQAFAARLNGERLPLSPREFRLLLELARQPDQVVIKGDLAQRLEPLGDPLQFSALEVHLSNLRRKLGGERIKTVRGVGYMLKS